MQAGSVTDQFCMLPDLTHHRETAYQLASDIQQ